jgi:hypothetical protein
LGHTVFYSWQSDRPTREGRNFIERALQAAVTRIAEDMQVEEAVRDGLEVDRDTKDVPGSPPIFQTILSKIDRASVFVADLTFCGVRCDGGPTPNPNVLIEYGWALKSLSHFQVLTVMNEAYGKPTRESLPFDLAHMRFPITYNLPDEAHDAARLEEREQLAKKLEIALKSIFESKEFKERLPKAPERPLFKPKQPMNGKARFRARGQPLGVVQDLLSHMVGSPKNIPVNLAEGPALWLRVMPVYDPGRTWLVQDLKKQTLDLVRAPLLRMTTSVGGVQREDGYGYWPMVADEFAYAVAYVFNTGELWIIDAWLVRVPNYVELDESSFVTSLEMGVALLRHLGCPGPYHWVAGMEGIEGLQLVTPGRFARPHGICLSNVIEEEGNYKEGDKVEEQLRPFFEKVFDQCGARRPVSL